ncbi:MAG: YjbQ family protein [Acidobacteria bacterium]|nr:YjbQ family protein [Acidobacteriota bacterium]
MIVADYTLRLKTRGVCHIIDITGRVAEQVGKSGIQSGTVTVFVVGSTAGVTTVEYEPGLVKDLEELFDKLAPASRSYHHEQTWHDGNGFSHVRASLLKPSLVVPIVKGAMRLGTWQQIVVVDFDNRPRDREIALQIMGV